MRKNQFLGEELECDENDKRTALFQIHPCPLEKTVSYGGGTARGPKAIIAASHQLERLIEGVMPCQHGIYTHKAINCAGSIATCIDRLRHEVCHTVRLGKIPITIGGEHSLSYGAIMGVRDGRSASFGVIQIDAHADLRHAYQGEKHAHASVMDLVVREGFPLFQLGVRAFCVEEVAARKKYNVGFMDARALVESGVKHVHLASDFPKDIYISFDVDGLDPSIMPATGTPVPGGLGYYQTLGLLEHICAGRQIIGFDLVELAPNKAHPASDFTAAMLIYHMMRLAVETQCDE